MKMMMKKKKKKKKKKNITGVIFVLLICTMLPLSQEIDIWQKFLL